MEKIDRCISNLFVFRPLLGQFLSDFEYLDTLLIGEARSLIIAYILIIYIHILKNRFLGLTVYQGSNLDSYDLGVRKYFQKFG